jgi:hypothetical protein
MLCSIDKLSHVVFFSFSLFFSLSHFISFSILTLYDSLSSFHLLLLLPPSLLLLLLVLRHFYFSIQNVQGISAAILLDKIDKPEFGLVLRQETYDRMYHVDTPTVSRHLHKTPIDQVKSEHAELRWPVGLGLRAALADLFRVPEDFIGNHVDEFAQVRVSKQERPFFSSAHVGRGQDRRLQKCSYICFDPNAADAQLYPPDSPEFSEGRRFASINKILLVPVYSHDHMSLRNRVVLVLDWFDVLWTEFATSDRVLLPRSHLRENAQMPCVTYTKNRALRNQVMMAEELEDSFHCFMLPKVMDDFAQWQNSSVFTRSMIPIVPLQERERGILFLFFGVLTVINFEVFCLHDTLLCVF